MSSSDARSHGWRVGSAVPVTFTDGTTTDLTVGAVYSESDLVGAVVVPRATWAPHAVQDLDTTVYVALGDGVSVADGTTAVERVTTLFGQPQVLDRAGYVAEATGGIGILLGLVYVMLALAIVIALLGIANTLSLSIVERTREHVSQVTRSAWNDNFHNAPTNSRTRAAHESRASLPEGYDERRVRSGLQ